MSALWTALLLMASPGPSGEPPPPPEAAHPVSRATGREHLEALDLAQLSLGEWVAARRELLRELEALRRRGGHPGAAARLERWRAVDMEAELRRIQDGLNAARRRLSSGAGGG